MKRRKIAIYCCLAALVGTLIIWTLRANFDKRPAVSDSAKRNTRVVYVAFASGSAWLREVDIYGDELHSPVAIPLNSRSSLTCKPAVDDKGRVCLAYNEGGELTSLLIINSGKLVRRPLESPIADVRAIEWVNTRQVAALTSFGRIPTINVNTGKWTLTFGQDWPPAQSPDGRYQLSYYVARYGGYYTALVDRVTKQKWPLPGKCSSYSWSPQDGTLAVVARGDKDYGLYMVDCATGTAEHIIISAGKEERLGGAAYDSTRR